MSFTTFLPCCAAEVRMPQYRPLPYYQRHTTRDRNRNKDQPPTNIRRPDDDQAGNNFNGTEQQHKLRYITSPIAMKWRCAPGSNGHSRRNLQNDSHLHRAGTSTRRSSSLPGAATEIPIESRYIKGDTRTRGSSACPPGKQKSRYLP